MFFKSSHSAHFNTQGSPWCFCRSLKEWIAISCMSLESLFFNSIPAVQDPNEGQKENFFVPSGKVTKSRADSRSIPFFPIWFMKKAKVSSRSLRLPIIESLVFLREKRKLLGPHSILFSDSPQCLLHRKLVFHSRLGMFSILPVNEADEGKNILLAR